MLAGPPAAQRPHRRRHRRAAQLTRRGTVIIPRGGGGIQAARGFGCVSSMFFTDVHDFLLFGGAPKAKKKWTNDRPHKSKQKLREGTGCKKKAQKRDQNKTQEKTQEK